MAKYLLMFKCLSVRIESHIVRFSSYLILYYLAAMKVMMQVRRTLPGY